VRGNRALKFAKIEETPGARSKNRMAMDKTIRNDTSFDEMKADEYRYWQSRPVHERMDAEEEMARVAWELKGWKSEPDVPGSQRPFVRLPGPWR
jgi:hypothetical protein